jgi:hypothetical protein
VDLREIIAMIRISGDLSLTEDVSNALPASEFVWNSAAKDALLLSRLNGAVAPKANLPIQAEVSGDRHPGTLTTRSLRASVLESVRRQSFWDRWWLKIRESLARLV